MTDESSVSADKGIRYATILDVLCLHRTTADADTQSVQCNKVEFEFRDSAGKLSSRHTERRNPFRTIRRAGYSSNRSSSSQNSRVPGCSRQQATIAAKILEADEFNSC